jgi:hypothetical protein
MFVTNWSRRAWSLGKLGGGSSRPDVHRCPEPRKHAATLGVNQPDCSRDSDRQSA